MPCLRERPRPGDASGQALDRLSGGAVRVDEQQDGVGVVATTHDDNRLAPVPVDELLEPRRAVVQIAVTEVGGDPEVVGERLDGTRVGDVVGGVHRLDLLEVDRRREPRDVREARRVDDDKARGTLQVAHTCDATPAQAGADSRGASPRASRITPTISPMMSLRPKSFGVKTIATPAAAAATICSGVRRMPW